MNGNAEIDLHCPVVYHYLFNDHAYQVLSLVKGQLIDAPVDSVAEYIQPVEEMGLLIPDSKFSAQDGLLLSQLGDALAQRPRASLQFIQVNNAGLIGVEQSLVLTSCCGRAPAC